MINDTSCLVSYYLAGNKVYHTFRVQCMDFELQWRVLQMELSGGGHNLDLINDVHNGITAQYLSCNCKQKKGQTSCTVLMQQGAAQKRVTQRLKDRSRDSGTTVSVELKRRPSPN